MQSTNDTAGTCVTSEFAFEKFKGTESLLFKYYYRAFKRLTEEETGCLIQLAVTCGAITTDESTTIQSNERTKMDSLIKLMLRKDNKYSFLLFEELKGNTKLKCALKESEKYFQDHYQAIGPDNNHLHLDFEDLRRNREFLYEDLQVSICLDWLFENGVITLEEHDQVSEMRTRPNERKKLVDILFSKQGKTWIQKFTRMLLMYNQALLNKLKQNDQHTECLEQFPRDGQTRHPSPFQPTGVVNVIAHLDTNVPEDSVNNSNPGNSQATSDENLTVLDYWHGFIYFLLSTTSPSILHCIRNGNGNDNMLRFLEQFFDNNKEMLKYFDLDKVQTLEMREKPQNVFVDENFGRKPTLKHKSTNGDGCAGCFLATVIKNYRHVLEIEEDIIDETLRKTNKQCFLSKLWTGPRSRRAQMFLQYVLSNKDVLMEFKNIFAHYSKLQLERHMCESCSGNGPITKPNVRKFSFSFVIKYSEQGNIKISAVPEEIKRPPEIEIIQNITEEYSKAIEEKQLQPTKTNRSSAPLHFEVRTNRMISTEETGTRSQKNDDEHKIQVLRQGGGVGIGGKLWDLFVPSFVNLILNFFKVPGKKTPRTPELDEMNRKTRKHEKHSACYII